MMLHASLCWPEVADPALWPIGVDYAAHVDNYAPNPTSVQSPMDIFTASMVPRHGLKDSSQMPHLVRRSTILTNFLHTSFPYLLFRFRSFTNLLFQFQSYPNLPFQSMSFLNPVVRFLFLNPPFQLWFLLLLLLLPIAAHALILVSPPTFFFQRATLPCFRTTCMLLGTLFL
jgi:hypothetical protein